MNGPRSVGVNQSGDGHPDDYGNRNVLRLRILTGLENRRREGMSLRDVGKELGHARDFATTPYHPDRHPTSVWLFDQTAQLCTCARLSLRVSFQGVEGQSALWDMSQDMPQFQGVGAMDKLKDTRVLLGLTNQEMADRLGTVKSAVWKAEEGSNPRLSTIQRYARALGGRALFTGKAI